MYFSEFPYEKKKLLIQKKVKNKIRIPDDQQKKLNFCAVSFIFDGKAD